MKYNVYEGVYPFTNQIGVVEVAHQDDPEKEAAMALYQAINLYKGHPVVSPA
jgi:hypothetical protein